MRKEFLDGDFLEKEITLTVRVPGSFDDAMEHRIDEALSDTLFDLGCELVDSKEYKTLEGGGAAASRLELLKAYKANERLLMDPNQRERLEEVDSLVEQIRALRPRIADLLAVANACLENGIELNMAQLRRGFPVGRRLDSYEEGTFVSNDYSPRVGFIQTWGDFDNRPHVFKEVGIVNNKGSDFYDFRTDGVKVYFVYVNGGKAEIKGPSHKVEDLRLFVQTFDAFESAFYAYVDKVIENQQRSVDAILADAGERSGATQESEPAQMANGKDDWFGK